MNIYLKMSISYLKRNKLSSTLLVLGIALGVMLVFGVDVITESQQKNNLDTVRNLYGGYHAIIKDVDKSVEDKLKTDENVKKITTVQNLGEAVNYQGISVILSSADKEFIDQQGYKLSKGRLPNSQDEIILEKEALKKMNIPDELNTTINFTVKKTYKEESGDKKTINVNKDFTIVGIVEKPNYYYEDFYRLNAFTYDNKVGVGILPQNIVTYDSIISLKTGDVNIGSELSKLVNRNNIARANYEENVRLSQLLGEINDSNDPAQDIKDKLIIAITATVLVYNIFNIFLNETINQMGMMRLIGASKNKVRYILFYQSIIVMILGIFLGILGGLIFSYIGINVFKYSFLKIEVENPKLYVSLYNVIKSILIGAGSVLIASVIPIWISGKISPIESIRKTDKLKGQIVPNVGNKLLFKTFGFTFTMGVKNIFRNKIRTVISIVSIALGGYLFIKTFDTSMVDAANEYSVFNGQISSYDLTIGSDANTDKVNVGYTKGDIEEIKKISGVKTVNYKQDFVVNIVSDSNKMNKEYLKYNALKESGTIVNDANLKLFTDIDIKGLEDFISDGSIDNLYKEIDGYPNVAVSNYYYDVINDHSFKKVYNEVKIGDILTLKIPFNENGSTVYKTRKVRVGAILGEKWKAKASGRYLEIITSDKNLGVLSNPDSYSDIEVELENENDKKAINSIEKIVSKRGIPSITSTLGVKNENQKYRDNFVKSKMLQIVLVLLIATINIFCTIRTNILIRMRELSTLRAIGMSVRNIGKMIYYEALIYGLFSSLIAIVPVCIKSITFINWANKLRETTGGGAMYVKFKFPMIPWMTFILIAVILCILTVRLSKKYITKISIIEGIKDNE